MRNPPRRRYSRSCLALSGEKPVAHFDGIEQGPVVDVIGAIELYDLLDGAASMRVSRRTPESRWRSERG